MNFLFDRLKQRTGLLLVLAVALAGFLLLINLLGPLTSSGPDDLLAATPSEEKHVGLPSGAKMFAFAVGAVGVVLAIVALAARRHWTMRGRIPRPRRSLVIGALAAVILGGAGLYLAFSGALTQDIAYEQHQAQRTIIEPKGLVVLGAFFLSLAAVGIFRPRLLLVHLAIWLLLSLIFGFFGSASLAGLKLLNQPAEIGESEAYAAEVEKYRVPQPLEEFPISGNWDVAIPLENGNAALARGSTLLLSPGASADPGANGIPNQLFKVTGAAHSSLLRSATGDIYENGKWAQLDPLAFQVDAGAYIPSEVLAMIADGPIYQGSPENGQNSPLPSNRVNPDLLSQPSSVADAVHIDDISVSPAADFRTLAAGVLPISALPLEVEVNGTWRPFSRTFRSNEPLEGYRWRSLTAEFPESALEKAAPADDPTYFKLPDGIPQRVRSLAEEITEGIDSPYKKAQAIEDYLKSEYSYFEQKPDQGPLQAPQGVEPVDWFLFDHPSGGATAFSSAFALLARASGVPARVVSGWAIAPVAEEQTVTGAQAHQWAEIALDGFGWISFDPTPRPGAPEPLAAGDDEQTSGRELSEQPDTGRESEPETGEPEDAPSPWEAIALENLAFSTDPRVRAEAALYLGQLGSSRVLEGLARAMLNDRDGLVREAAVAGAALADFDLLADILLKHEDSLLRVAAAAGLGKRGQARALSPLGQALASDADPEVRAAVADALGALGMKGGLESLKRALVSDPDADERVRAAAAEALGKIGDPDALPSLMQASSEDESPEVRSAASDALDEYPLHSLTAALEDSGDSSTRAAAAEILGQREGPAAAPALIHAMSDPEEEVREAALAAVEELGTITTLENGSGLLSHGEGVSFIPGATASQAGELPHIPVFEVSRATYTDFLRTAVGDRYVGGQWFQDHQTGVKYLPANPAPNLGPPSQPTVPPSSEHSNHITIVPAGDERWIPEGVIPTSPGLTTLSLPGTVFPLSATFASDFRVTSYNWSSTAPVYSEAQLNAANLSPHYAHKSLPEDMPERIRGLAEQIVAGHSTPYQRAKAIEQYLRTNYAYRLADPTAGGVPPGRDPVDWFLFESREGTCGNFSSAFVALARSIGFTARVVSGWAIAPTGEDQIVYADQAHQRAEVAFEGLGWIPFEPTASGGPPDRAPEYSEEGGTVSQRQQEELEAQVEQLSSDEPEDKEQARGNLTSMGAEVTEAENGGSVVSRGSEILGMSGGTTTAQATRPDPIPLFVVTGAAHTSYLRTTVGDVYDKGWWRQLEPVSLAYKANQSVPHLVRNEMAREDGLLASLPAGRVDSALLARFDADPAVTVTDTIRVESLAASGKIPAGVVPTARSLDSVEFDGRFRPFSGTFVLTGAVASYSWVSQAPRFSEAQLSAAAAVSDSTYTQLPESLPQRIRDLAQEVTDGHDSVYAKAKALETYLSSQYTYRFADGSGRESPPPGRDPVDWFLFDHREGTCGVFSSAFVVMARSVGIPARVVSGWAISQTEEEQTVRLDQAHQWAEVALEGVGWVRIEATASGGPLSRAPLQPQEPPQLVGEMPEEPPSGSEPPQQVVVPDPAPSPPRPALPVDTVTAITAWPVEARRRASFAVGGTVRSESGSPVSGVEVEIFVNETKEHGGTKIGQATTRNGRFQAEVRLPSSMERGPYQLLAHAIGNELFAGSWSDPDITVYSESGLQLTGPEEVAVDTQALFRGKFLDDTGSGAAGQQLQVTVDGRGLPPLRAGPSGEFSFAQTFSETGPHSVEVEFEEQDFLTGNSVRLDFTAVMPTKLTVDPIGKVVAGDTFPIKGILLDARGEPMVSREIRVIVGEEPELSVITGDDGAFSVDGAIDTPGEFAVRAEFTGEYPVLSSNATSRGLAQHVTALSLSGPRSVMLGESAAFRGSISSGTLPDIGSRQLTIEDRDGITLASLMTAPDGSFEHLTESLDATGPQSLTVKFREEGELASASTSFSFVVIAPTLLTVEGPELVQSGETVELKGVLIREDGQPVAAGSIWVGDQESQLLVTGSDGGFSREFPMEANLGDSDLETTVEIVFGFDGTDHLAPALGSHTVTIGLPWIAVEPTEPVVRGETAILRGSVLLGARPLPEAIVSAEQGLRAVTTDTGSFLLRFPIPADSPLGRNELPISIPALDLEASVPVDVKSTVSLVVVPLEEVRPDREVMIQATLTDDSAAGISGALLRTSQGAEGTTGDLGVALLTLRVPDTEELLAVPVTFTYEGDQLHVPLSYFIGIPVTPTGFNWMLWVGLPALLVAVAASGYAARRMGASGVRTLAPVRLRRRRAARPLAVENLPVPAPGAATEPEPEPVPEPQPTVLAVAFNKATPDLPDVWGVGERISIYITLSVEDGPVIGGATVEGEGPDRSRLLLETGEQGSCAFDYTTDGLGEYMVSASFPGNDDFLESSDSRSFQVVDFREEIVRLYNSFVEWAGERAPGMSGRTPRELESMLASSGLSLDHRAIDEVISRFEEADYSEHLIGRRQYESMYRSWHTVVGE